MKRAFVLFLAVLMVVSMAACGGDPAETTAPSTTAAPTTVPETTVPPTTVPETTAEPTTVPTTVPETTAPVVIEYPYTNPLTGEGQMTEQMNRPYAVVINNIKAALPHHGVSQADMLYEILAEGGITRCLAVFTDISDVEKLGSVRSARTYFIDLAKAYDAILVHAGGSEYAYDEFANSGWAHLDGIQGASKYFYRDQARLSKGVAKEHTLFTSGEKILAAAEAKKLKTARDEAMDYGLTFSETVDLAGDAANKVTLNFTKKRETVMTYNPETGLYEGYQQGGDYIDGNTGEIMAFKNVIVLHARTSSDGYRMFADLVGTGNGYFACNGEMVAIKWSRKSAKQPFVYTLKDGTPIELGIGTTYVGILPNTSSVDFE